jgi:medium-chain acyl-[acyl-carrier-protein] hydrolase
MRLVCFPYAGGGPAAFRPWARALPADVELCIVHLPGREGRWREPALSHADAVIGSIAEALLPLVTTPYAFYGHSLGTLLAFEVARYLHRNHGTVPLRLVGGAHRAPHLPNPHPEIRQLGDDQFVAEINRRYGGIPQLVLDNRELLELMLPALRADFSVYETYQYQEAPPLRCPIAVFGGSADRFVSAAEVGEWRRHTAADFQHTMLPGDHFFIQQHRAAVLGAAVHGTGAPAAEPRR